MDYIVINTKITNKEVEEIGMINEQISWIKAKDNKMILNENKVVVSRDEDCPYRYETLKYLKDYKSDMPLIEVDTIDILISMIEMGSTMAILPKKTISRNDKLECMDEITCSAVPIRVYKLKNNNSSFKIDLCH